MQNTNKTMKTFKLNILKNSSIPLYTQIENDLLRLIKSGYLKIGDYIPPEDYIAQINGISKMTVRKAILNLTEKGYLRRERGKGTFVLRTKMIHPLKYLTSFSEDMISRGLIPDADILTFKKIIPSNDIASIMGIALSSKVIYIKRLRMANNIPVGIHESYLYLPHIEIKKRELVEERSLYKVLEKKGIIFTKAEETIEAVMPQEEERKLLNIKKDNPLLLITRLAYTSDEVNKEYVKAWYLSDLYKYQVILEKRTL